ncbi:MAG: hypothetical protein ABSD38_37075 [Syntrophorhabdales bacterium]|jgi:hypothetical protein|nr:hypothetical protein [Deltaproteobacteria bacterium]
MALDRFAGKQSKEEPPPLNRPYISIVAIAFSNIVICPGHFTIRWDIKNSGLLPAQVSEANMTLGFETKDSKLPETPKYVPSPHVLAGVSVVPGETFNATFTTTRVFSPADVAMINKGVSVLYVFGYVK